MINLKIYRLQNKSCNLQVLQFSILQALLSQAASKSVIYFNDVYDVFINDVYGTVAFIQMSK
jgi:hypothetical protein